jgi:hypothetical protein
MSEKTSRGIADKKRKQVIGVLKEFYGFSAKLRILMIRSRLVP